MINKNYFLTLLWRQRGAHNIEAEIIPSEPEAISIAVGIVRFISILYSDIPHGLPSNMFRPMTADSNYFVELLLAQFNENLSHIVDNCRLGL